MAKLVHLLTLTLLTLTCTVLPLGQARQRPLTAPLRQYERIALALRQYRALADMDDGTPLQAVESPVQPGEDYDGTPRLIRLLSLLGDLPAEAVPPDSTRYEGELVEAVKRFQTRHGLQPDGVIGPATLDQLNTPLRVRVRQLELALERWRRRPYDPRRPAIVLNLPEFRLRAYAANSDAEQEPELEMKVVVGEAPEHKSPVLQSQLEVVILRPYWTVPVSIQRNELIPEISRDRSWVSANNFELVTPDGEVVGSAKVSDHILSELSSGKLQLRQKPGPKNTLGLVKFMFPNRFGIYMHDTSARWLFDRERRDLSHGCIRVENPADLAEWVLRRQPGWSRERIDAAIQGTESISVKITHPVQLAIMYSTAVVMKNGEVHFFADIYGEDEALERELVAQRK
ncbi:MAG TPA: L,D-transpeptidase family protein [Candidatus Solibacter sp.]|nr:L,D-transpeptidase family protein [Candidatus Solibacter sp.]